jgi:hypothetical protein
VVTASGGSLAAVAPEPAPARTRAPGPPHPDLARRLSLLLRRPALVLAELGALVAGAIVAASVPQSPDAEAIARFAAERPLLGRATAALGLHAVTTSGAFLAVVALCLASLVALQLEQWSRLPRLLRAPLTTAAFDRAQYRVETPLAAGRAAPPPTLVRRGRLGLLGSPLFHAGLVLVVVAGLVRVLLFREALVRVFDGATLSGPIASRAERGGPLSRPIVVEPIRLDGLRVRYGDDGALVELGAKLRVGAEAREASLQRSSPFRLGWTQLALGNGHGVAVLATLRDAAGARKEVAYLRPGPGRALEGRLDLGKGGELRFRARSETLEVDHVEVRALKSGLLAALAELAPGAELALADGSTVAVDAIVPWTDLLASSDPSRGLFVAGVLVGLLGLALMVLVAPHEEGVYVEDGRLVVALRAPPRFAPLYVERFEKLRRRAGA